MRAFALSFLSAWLLLAHPALADAKDPPEYTEAINLGVSEFQAENFTEARAHFAHAHALYPNARTLRALGMVAFELKRYTECAQYLTDALASRDRALEGEKRVQTEKLLTRANGYLARFTLQMAPGTKLSVDGVASDLGSGGELVLEAGDHVLEFHATGRNPDRRNLTIQGGERETLRVSLAALEVGPASKPTGPSPADEDKRPGRPVYKNPWLWTAIGIVVAGAAVTAGVMLAADTTTKTKEPYPGTGGAPALETPR